MAISKALLACAALAAVVALGAPGTAANAAPAPSPNPAAATAAERLPADEAAFMRAFDTANTSELDQAKYVLNRTNNSEVRAFAQHMIDDHSTAAVQLEAAMRGSNLRPVPREADTSVAGLHVMSLLQSRSGADLDETYMRVQVPQHRRVLALLQWETQNGQTASLTALATKVMPVVQQHLQMAQGYLATRNLTPLGQ